MGRNAPIIQNDPDTVAAIIAEPVSAANGIHVPPKSYWEGLRRIADKYQVVLISDEVINGFGRLGEWFVAQCFGIQPDILEPYISVDPHKKITNKVVILRTLRYQNYFINYKFLENYEDLFFIGTKVEYDDLKKDLENEKK